MTGGGIPAPVALQLVEFFASSDEKFAVASTRLELCGVALKDLYINVSTRYETFIGGLVGNAQNGIYIDNCSVEGEITSTTAESFSRAGGLAGNILRGAVTNSFADVDIIAVAGTNNVYAGGFYAMDNRVTTFNCYALGNVTGNAENNNKVHIGGFAGQAGGIHYNCYAKGDVISLKTTTDVGAISGRSAGIAADLNCYYNSEAVVKQGNTVYSPAKAVGVNANNSALIKNVVGKTAAELASEDFASLLNENLSSENLAAADSEFAAFLEGVNSRGFTEVNYYTGNELLGWVLDRPIIRLVRSLTSPDSSSL